MIMMKNINVYGLHKIKLIADEKELTDNNLGLKLSKIQLV